LREGVALVVTEIVRGEVAEQIGAELGECADAGCDAARRVSNFVAKQPASGVSRTILRRA
jgi:hypothetical protein